MSMSQEEIEALMNGIEVPEDSGSSSEEVEEEVAVQETEEEQSKSMSEEDIAKLLSQTDEEAQELEEAEKAETIEDIDAKADDVKDNISEVLNEIDNMQEDEIVEEVANEQSSSNSEDDDEFNEKAKSWTEDKITKGEFPFPAEPSTKVVSQLNEVANDSEEKAGQIFDVLSYILDDNAITQKNNKKTVEFLNKQVELLNALSHKFPNIKLFEERLKETKEIEELTKDLSNRISAEDMKLFEAMELMQFHDINRQKIERVMSVIRKLTTYLNNLFEEDENYEEIAVAKHIHGDSNAELVGADDLDALIAEFSK